MLFSRMMNVVCVSVFAQTHELCPKMTTCHDVVNSQQCSLDWIFSSKKNGMIFSVNK